MSIKREEVEHIALLSRLLPGEAELESLTGDLQDILGYIEKLNQLDTEGVPATSHPIPLTNVVAADKVQTSLDVETALANAPDRRGPFFRVPRIVD